MAEEIAGLDTIRNLVGQPPREIPIEKATLEKQQEIMQGWNSCFIAVIPFCYKCKVPLVWHTPPDTDVLFHCPQCARKFVKASDWPESTRNIKYKEEPKNDNNRGDGQQREEHSGRETK